MYFIWIVSYAQVCRGHFPRILWHSQATVLSFSEILLVWAVCSGSWWYRHGDWGKVQKGLILTWSMHKRTVNYFLVLNMWTRFCSYNSGFALFLVTSQQDQLACCFTSLPAFSFLHISLLQHGLRLWVHPPVWSPHTKSTHFKNKWQGPGPSPICGFEKS